MQRPPVADPAFPKIAGGGAPDAVVGEALGMQQLQVTQQRHCLDRGLALEDRQQILFPDLGQRVRAKSFGNARPRSTLPDHPPKAMAAADRHRCPPAIALGGALAEAGPGGGGALAVGVAIMHVEAHLLVVDGVARQDGSPLSMTEFLSYRPAAASTPSLAPSTEAQPVGPASGRATPTLHQGPPANMAVATGQGGCRSTLARTRARQSARNRWGRRPSTASMCHSGGVERPQQRRRPWELSA